jgi:flagellar basal body rod protein FlgG
MLQGIYSAASNLDALERWQETISQNLAAGPSAGYRKVQFAVESLPSGKAGAFKAIMPHAKTNTSFAPGDRTETGKKTDFAVQGPGFFQVKGPDGKPVFTRDGEFHVNAQGTLVTKRGWEVAGAEGPITIDPQKSAPVVSREGVITQDDTTIGKIGLFDFAKPDTLQRRDAGFFAPPAGVSPTPVANPEILQGYTEKGNSESLNEMVSLVSVGRAYEASQKVIGAEDDILHEAIQSLGNPTA